MSVTNYITANGMLVGEMTGGVMTTYGPDALGSVVATYSGTSLENTYQYKPYGATLAKTASAPDPSFLWNGTSGYRSTGLNNASFYVRRRHFSEVSIIWTTVDPTWPIEAPYVYSNGNPLTWNDPTGLCSCIAAPGKQNGVSCAKKGVNACCETWVKATPSCSAYSPISPSTDGATNCSCSPKTPACCGWSNVYLDCSVVATWTITWIWANVQDNQSSTNPTTSQTKKLVPPCGSKTDPTTVCPISNSCPSILLNQLKLNLQNNAPPGTKKMTCTVEIEQTIKVQCGSPPTSSGGGSSS